MKHYHTFLYSTCILALGALLAVGLSGCTADELVDEPDTVSSELGDVIVMATLGQGVDTRTGHEESADGTGAVKVTWVPGDDIKIVSFNDDYSISSATTFTFAGMNGNSTVSGIFKGKAEPTITKKQYLVLYPAHAAIHDDGNILLDMTGQTQWGNDNMAHLGAYDVMYTNVGDWKSFSFADDEYGNTCHTNALMTFDLKGIPADLGRPQSITLGCTSTAPVFSSNVRLSDECKVPTLELKLTGFATPADPTFDIKAYMMIAWTTIPAGESLTITVKGEEGSYTFTSAAMGKNGKTYKAGKRYTATVGAGNWKKVYSDFIYTGAEPVEALTGSGTSATDPHVIATAGQLRKLIEETQTGDGFSGKFFRLGANVDIKMAAHANSGNWTPIGTGAKPFCGTFDGDGHTISGTMTGTESNFGFFGYIKGATIKNLTVDATVSSNDYVGGIVGQSGLYCSIINCINKGTVTASVGSCGGITSYTAQTYILGCANQGNISGQGASSSYGGIAGFVFGGAIVGCYNTAVVTIPSSAGGGIVGTFRNSAAMTACYNTGKVVQESGTNTIGAIAGVTEAGTIVSYCQYVLDATNIGLPAFGSSTGTPIYNTKHDNLDILNGDGVAALNDGITVWNTDNASNPCPFHFVAGTTTGPTLASGAPN